MSTSALKRSFGLKRCAVSKRDFLGAFGGNTPAPAASGGTGYVQFADLPQRHLATHRRRTAGQQCVRLDLETGRGVSMKQHGDMFSSVNAVAIQLFSRRTGASAGCYTNIAKAQHERASRALLNAERMCSDAWRLQSPSPDGFC